LTRVLDAARARALQPKRLLLSLSCAAAVTIGLAAVLFVPLVQLLGYSERASRSLAYVMNRSMSPTNLIGILLPGQMRGGGVYLGVIPVMLCAAALLCPPRRDRVPLALGVMGAFALLLAVGENGSLLERLAMLVPGFDLFRVPERYSLLFNAAAACLTAYGAAALVRPADSEEPTIADRRWRGLVVGAYVYIGLVFLAFMVTTGPNASKVVTGGLKGLKLLDGLGLGLLMAIIGVALIGPLLLRRRPVGSAFWPLIIVFVLVDLWAGQNELYTVYEKVRSYSNDQDLSQLPGVDKEWRIYDEYHFEQRVGARRRVRDFFDYYVAPLAQQRWVDVIEFAKTRAAILHHFNVRWVLRGPHHRKGKAGQVIPDSAISSAYQQAGPSWLFESTEAVPAVMWYGKVEWVPPGGNALELLFATRPGDHAVLEPADVPERERGLLQALSAPPTPSAPEAVPGKVLALTDNGVDTDVDAPADGLVVSNESWYPGWEARVDGRPARVFRVNYLLRGVLVGVGHHRIEWRFRPLGFLVFFPLYVLTVLFLAGWSVAGLLRWRADQRH
jgi:hypothetical protein